MIIECGGMQSSDLRALLGQVYFMALMMNGIASARGDTERVAT